jgi:hypothetical protein
MRWHPSPPRRLGGNRGRGSTSWRVRGWAITIGVVVGIAIALFVRQRRATPERTEGAGNQIGRSAAGESAGNQPVVLRDAIDSDDVRVDMYLPARGTLPAPWMVFAEERARTGVAEEMQRRGIAVALLSFATHEGEPSQRTGERVAEVVRELARRTSEYGLVPKPVLAGNEGGASLVGLLALDAHFGLERSKLGGVVAMNGAYDTPLPHVRAEAPPFLILSAHGDPPDSAQRTRAFARALERAGAKTVRSYHVSARDERALADLSGERNEVADLVASFVRGEPAPGGPESAWAVADAWGARAPLSTEPFWADERLVVRRPVDDDLRAQIGRFFADTMRDLDPWPRKTYDTIDLTDYLGAHPELGSGNWLVVTNARGEQIVLSHDQIQKERPVIVVGMDDERNLFRLLVTYNVYRTYTFKPETEPRPLLARPVGGFLYFPKARRPRAVTFADFALTTSSFRVIGDDPLASVRALPKPLLRTLTDEQGCLQCHSLRGAGARSHHLRALDGKPTGGDALAFEEYPREVMRRFLFEQDEVAQIFGVAPIRVDKQVATQLIDEVSR